MSDQQQPPSNWTEPRGEAQDDSNSDDDALDDFDGHLGEESRGAADVAPPAFDGYRSTSFAGLSEVDPADMAEADFNPQGDVFRSLEVSSRPQALSFGFDFEPAPATVRNSEAIKSPTAVFTSTRAEQSLEGIDVLDVPFYYRLGMLTASLGPCSGAGVEAAALKVCGALHHLKIDFKVVADISEWTCFSFSDHGSHFSFVVRLWRRSGELLLESLRRSGDAFGFSGLHHAVVAHCTGAPLPPPAPRFGEPFPPPPPAAATAAAEDAHADDLAPVVAATIASMAGHAIDTVYEATRTLAALSADAAARPVLHRCGAVPALAALLKASPAVTMGHFGAVSEAFAVTCLANLSEEPLCQASLVPCLGLLLDRVADGNFHDRCMRREAARALRNVARDAAGADTLIKAVGKERLASWAATTFPALLDAQMLDDAREVKQSVEARWVACV